MYRLSAEQGNGDGQWRLGNEYGKGVRNELANVDWMHRLSTEQGNACVQHSEKGRKTFLQVSAEHMHFLLN